VGCTTEIVCFGTCYYTVYHAAQVSVQLGLQPSSSQQGCQCELHGFDHIMLLVQMFREVPVIGRAPQ